MLFDNNTICAIATAPGLGAISVIRLSGADTFPICDSISNKKGFAKENSHTIHFCKIVENEIIIDEVLISIFKNPKSYTGEDVAEISCHGSTYIQQKIMELLIKNGARLANPGEFTLRAFINGKMDLSQAEAVADLIHSTSQTNHGAAINQMRGGFSKEISTLRTQLLNFASLIELELDFSEEDVEFANRKDLKNNILKISGVVKLLIGSFQLGNVIKNGVPVAIVGKPNVGKSTLLNALLKEEKAIVSDIAGTTRDAIEDTINIEGFGFRFIDTAGIRHTTDTIENLGIERTYENIRKASVILLLVDATEESSVILEQVKNIDLLEGQEIAVILNKIDKVSAEKIDETITQIKALKDISVIKISAKKQENLHEIHKLLVESVRNKSLTDNNILVTNIRHFEALNNTLEAGDRVISGLDFGLSTDLLAQDIRQMLYHLGTITGEITTDEILGNIFSKFCIGK